MLPERCEGGERVKGGRGGRGVGGGRGESVGRMALVASCKLRLARLDSSLKTVGTRWYYLQGPSRAVVTLSSG